MRAVVLLQSAALGLAIAGALALGYSNIFVTAPSPENLRTLFEFVFKGLDNLDYKEHIDYDLVESTNPAFQKAIVRVNVFRSHRQVWHHASSQTTVAKRNRWAGGQHPHLHRVVLIDKQQPPAIAGAAKRLPACAESGAAGQRCKEATRSIAVLFIRLLPFSGWSACLRHPFCSRQQGCAGHQLMQVRRSRDSFCCC